MVVLLGPNGSAKSTVLDALLIGTSPRVGEAVGRAVRRRVTVQPTAPWLFHARGSSAELRVGFTHEGQDGVRRTELSWTSGPLAGEGDAFGATDSTVWITVTPGRKVSEARTVFKSDNSYRVSTELEHIRELSHQPAGFVRLVDLRGVASGAADPSEVLTDAKAQGRAEAAFELLREIVPGFRNLEILKMGDGFGVWMNFEKHAVPLVMAGDGVRGLARLCLELAARSDGFVLLEEPEVHQHPKALQQSARAIVSAAKRGIQVVLATHSLDLLDDLLRESEREGLLDATSVQRLRLEDGALHARRFLGPEARQMRSELELELR